MNELPAFLIALHGIVLQSPAPAALDGTIAVGVRQDGGARWWAATFDARSSVRGVDAHLDVERPAHASAWILLGTRSADALVAGQPLSPTDVDVGGDTALLDRFLARYGHAVRGWQTRGSGA